MTTNQKNLPRLDRSNYRGLAQVHWVLNVEDRRTGWLDERFFLRFQLLATHTFHRYDLASPMICLMPDHIHLLVLGLNESGSDQVVAMSFLRKHLKESLAPFILQRPPYDHVLRKDERLREAFQKTANYISLNPFRAGLTNSEAASYAFTTNVIPGYPDLPLHSENYWEIFWKIYHRKIDECNASPHPA